MARAIRGALTRSGELSRYARLSRYALREWRILAFVLGLNAAASAVTALQPWPMKLLVDHALGGVPVPVALTSLLDGLGLPPTPASLLVAAAAGSLGLFALYSAVDAGLSWAWTAAGRRMVHDLAADLFHRLQRLSLLFHSRRTVGDSLSRLTGDTWCVYTVTEALLISPAHSVVMLAALGAVAWRLDPGLAALSSVAAPMLGGSAILFGRRLKPQARKNREAHSRLLTFVHQTLTVIPVVQAFGGESRNGRQFRRLAAESVAASQQSTLLNSAYGLANGVSTTLGAGLVLYVGGQRVLSGLLSVGSLLVFLAYLRSMERAWQVLLENFARLKSVEARFFWRTSRA